MASTSDGRPLALNTVYLNCFLGKGKGKVTHPAIEIKELVGRGGFTEVKDEVYQVEILPDVYLAEAPSFGLPVLYYDKQSKGALAYLALAGEMQRRSEAHLQDIA